MQTTYTVTYRLQLAEDAEFKHVFFDRKNILELSYELPFLLTYNKTFYVRVREEVRNANDDLLLYSEYSDYHRFTTRSNKEYIHTTNKETGEKMLVPTYLI